MGEKLGEAVLELRTDDTKLEVGIKKAGRSAEGLASKFDRFGGRARNAGALLSLGLTAPIMAFGVQAAGAAKESAEAMGQVESALASMGDVSGRTAGQLSALAEKQMGRSLFDDDEILRKVTANLLTFGNVAGEAFDRGQQAALDMSARLGTDLQGSAIMVGKALNDPIAGITALTRTGVQFTAQQKEQIKAMVAAGDQAGAQKMILGELERQFGGAAQAMRDADPAAAMKQSLATLQEDVGAKILPLLPPLIAGLTGVLDIFGALPPGVQSFTLGLLATGAAIGPMLMGIGTLASGFARLLPLMMRLGPVIAIVKTALLGLLANPVVLAAAAVIAGIYLAWKNWDKIAPIIAAVAAAVTDWWNAKVKPILDAVGAKIEQVIGWFATMPGRIGIAVSAAYAAVKSWLGDKLSAVWDLMKSSAGQAIDFYASLPGRAGEAMRQLYLGVKTWIGDKLNAVWDGAKQQLQSLGDKFKWLWDVVVAHSYVPDLVDGVIAHFGRLEGGMVKPVLDATEQAAQGFDQLAQSAVQSIGSIVDKIRSGDFLGAIQGAIGLMGRLGQALGAGSGVGGFLGSASKLLGSIFGGSGGGFAGMFAKGGLIPNGSFGIVGEGGPEPVIGTGRGAMVLPNSSLRGGGGPSSLHVTVSGARGNAEIEAMVRSGIRRGLAGYDRVVGDRVGEHLDRRG